MASSEGALEERELGGTGTSISVGLTTRTASRSVAIAVRRAAWRDLARIELPLLCLLILFFLVTFLLSSVSAVTVFGFDLTVLIFCPVLALTGVPCLMCGITRSFLAMAGLDITGAFVFHPLGPFFILMLAALFLASAYSLVTRRQIRLSMSRKMKRRLIWSGTMIILAAWLVKVVIWYQVGLL